MALNGNGTAPNPSSDLVVRKLPENWGLEDDDPMVPLLQANAQLEAKVEQWSTAILELAALARQQNQAMQETSQNSLRLTGALSSFEQESVQLRTLIKQLGSSLSESKGGTGKRQEGLNQSALQTLMPLLDEIRAEMVTAKRHIAQTDRHNQAGHAKRRWLDYVVGLQAIAIGALLIGGFRLYGQIAAQEVSRWQYSNWILTKLERVEKALGIEKKAP
jgi:small-conductance mechanosensitive channel